MMQEGILRMRPQLVLTVLGFLTMQANPNMGPSTLSLLGYSKHGVSPFLEYGASTVSPVLATQSLRPEVAPSKGASAASALV